MKTSNIPNFTQTINKPINTEDQAKEFLNYLSYENLLYHPEDDANQILDHLTQTSIFSKETADQLNLRMSECYLRMTEDPCKYILENIINS